MKRTFWASLGIVLGYAQFRERLSYWIPAVGSLDSGYALGQVVVLGLIAIVVLGSTVSLVYRGLSAIFD